jgi:hypothetical protein
MSHGDLEVAVELYISMSESGQGGSPSSLHQASAPAHVLPPTAAPQPARQQTIIVPNDSDDDDYMEVDRSDFLPGHSSYAADLDRAIAQRDSQRQQAAHVRQQGLFGRAPPHAASVDAFANYSEPQRDGTLSKQFGMPVFCLNANPDISTFAHAKAAAHAMFKRLIVNILDQSLPSLNQNRDLWPQDDVAALVVEHYCLFQVHKNSDAGREYLQRYPLETGATSHKLPIIDILDPLTGACLLRSGNLDVRALCSILRQHSHEDASVGLPYPSSSYASPMPAPSRGSHASIPAHSDDGSVWSSLGDGGDGDIARAIAASLGDPEASAPLRPHSPPRSVSSAQKVRDETDHAYKESLMLDRLADEERERARRAEEHRLVMEKAKAVEEAQRAAQEEQARLQRTSLLKAKFAQEPTSSDSISLAFRCCKLAWLHWQIACSHCCLFRVADFLMVEGSNESSILATLCGRSTIMLNWNLALTPKKCSSAPLCRGSVALWCRWPFEITLCMQMEIACTDAPLAQHKVRSALSFSPVMCCLTLSSLDCGPATCCGKDQLIVNVNSKGCVESLG